MGGRYTSAQRLNWQQQRYCRQLERDARRTIVALTSRPEDDGIIDHVAVDLALRGHTRVAARLRHEEVIAAVTAGSERGFSALELAELLLLYEREVNRLRALVRARARREETQTLKEAVPA